MGQSGPLRASAGHDINYIAIAGVLGMIGPAGEGPVPPLNLVADFGGGLLTVFGIVTALLERAHSGVGQIVDSAMADGSALLATMFFEMSAVASTRDRGGRRARRRCAVLRLLRDRRRRMVRGRSRGAAVLHGPAPGSRSRRGDHTEPTRPGALAGAAIGDRDRVLTRTRDEWEKVFADVDACATPVLSLSEAVDHPHAVARALRSSMSAARGCRHRRRACRGRRAR